MTRLAIYDCGTNTTRLLIADVQYGRVSILERHDTITRLGQRVDATKLLSAESIERTQVALERYKTIADQYDVERSELIATSCVRDADNADEFAHAVEDTIGCRVRILSGETEAAYSFKGATHDVPWTESTLMFDIGGGSTEFALGLPGSAPTFTTSLQMGAVRLTEQYLHSDPYLPEELSQGVSVIREEFEQILRVHPELAEAKHLVGVAGTVTTAAAVEIGLDPYDPERVHHFNLTQAAAEDVFRTLATESLAERMKNPGLQPARADVIVGGLIILVNVMRVFGFENCTVSEQDILDGAALSLA